MKKAIILSADGNELANQLWNYASIYAYTVERGYKIVNPSFFEYGEYFTMPAPNWFFRIIFYLPFKNYTKRKTAFRRKLWRKLYSWLIYFSMKISADRMLSYSNKKNLPFYLPPTESPQAELSRLEHGEQNIYFNGWLFRNPIGLEKYRVDVLKYFKPREDIETEVHKQINNLRVRFKNIVGVHVRQGDYVNWRGGAYFIAQPRVREILNEYSTVLGLNTLETCFVITSDGPINTSLFAGLNILVSTGNAVNDLFLLSLTDTVVGSNSTFGAFASYYGNIPFVVMQSTEVEWSYYLNKKNYFENKYSTFVHY
ncbi:MAG: alpha-1,2-fucosyltransferase [bacterium]|nr:alpha-1,2-fucosyltransferase [bacterium]